MSNREYPPPPKASSEFASHLRERGWAVHTGDSYGSSGLVRDVFWHRAWGVRDDVRLQAEWEIARPSVYDEGWTPTATTGRWARSGSFACTRNPASPPLRFMTSLFLVDWNIGGKKVKPYETYVLLRSVADLRALADWDTDRIIKWLTRHNNLVGKEFG